VERDEIESVENWNNEEVLQWAEKINYTDFLKIIKYENVTGKNLVNVERQYLIGTLGINREDLLTKFMTEISKVSKATHSKQILYGWGNNNWGQLGIYTGVANVNHPMKISLPDLEQDDDEILKIECGFKQSAILTKKKNLWITDPHVKPTVIHPKSGVEFDEKKPSKEEKSNRKGSAKNEDKPEKRDKQHEKMHKKQEKIVEESLRWIDISDMARSLKDKKEYQILTFCFNKDNIAVLGAFMGKMNEKNKMFAKLLSNLRPGQIQSQKLKGADQIVNRIKWDKKQNMNEFTVGYDDRFLGIMDIPFVEFALKADIPSHRIYYFKRNGEIVWDRTNKIYNF